MVKKIVKLLLIIIWMGVIFSFSSDNGEVSESKSDGLILKVYKIFDNRELSKSEERKIIDTFVFPIRKLAHFTEYMILGLLVISFINEYKQINIRSIILAIILCCLYAASDEIHQLFSEGREGRIFDIFVDTCGASFGILVLSFIKTKLIRRKKYE